ncbi:MAG: hypothetical protein U9P44_03915, partial [archaeon]|nr:hypothetical protein [archaeon]
LKVNAKDTAAKACISACPRKLISSDFKLKKPYLCNFCGSCEDACPGVVTLTGDSTRIIFNVESVCGLSSKELVKQALGIMKINVGEFEEAFKKEIK